MGLVVVGVIANQGLACSMGLPVFPKHYTGPYGNAVYLSVYDSGGDGGGGGLTCGMLQEPGGSLPDLTSVHFQSHHLPHRTSSDYRHTTYSTVGGLVSLGNVGITSGIGCERRALGTVAGDGVTLQPLGASPQLPTTVTPASTHDIVLTDRCTDAMRSSGERLGWGGCCMWGQMPRADWLRCAVLLLAATACTVACTTAALIYRRQQMNDRGYRPIHALHGFFRGVDPQWTWICRNRRCERLVASESTILQSLPTCNMLCASTLLWPQPTGPVRVANVAVPIRADYITLQVTVSPSQDVTEHLKDTFKLMRHDIRSLEKNGVGKIRRNIGTPHEILIRVAVNGSSDVRLRLDTDESYTLSLRRKGYTLVADITAHSFCGARHGLETLSQFIWLDPYASSLLVLETASVVDAPRFHYRGLLLDTARNYFPVPEIIRTIDAMAACKMNTFHWHASDSQSFPLRLNSTWQLAQYGAYGPAAIYTAEDIRTIVRRARLRGIRVLIEIDGPAHVGQAWAWGPATSLGHLAYCIEEEPWRAFCGEPPCGQLNPRNPNVYDLLQRIYAEVIELTGVDDLFHIGGDEVSEKCWTQHVKDADPMKLWFDFTRRALLALEHANGGKVPEVTLLWSSRLTRSPYLKKLDKKQIGIQLWGGSRSAESRAVLDTGFRSVISHVDAWYLDCGFGSWRDSTDGHCGPYRSWQQIYEHRPWKKKAMTTGAKMWRIDGGEACQWTEQLGPEGLDTRVWPRTAALAERLWSDRGDGASADVYLRMDTQRWRLVARGVRAAPIWPQWCSHNPHACL